MGERELVCRVVTDPADPGLGPARRLYEMTLDPAERIPWEWIAGAVDRPADRRHGGGWSPRLVLAARPAATGVRETVIGFAYGIYLSGYGGYACYLGVDPAERRAGAGSRLLRHLIHVLEEDAAREGKALPFVIWESHRSAVDAPPEEHQTWRARLGLFARVGALAITGLTLWTPNFTRRSGPPVPLQLFLLPRSTPTGQFDAPALRDVAAGLLRRVYGRQPGDRLFDRSLPPGVWPALEPVAALETSQPPSWG